MFFVILPRIKWGPGSRLIKYGARPVRRRGWGEWPAWFSFWVLGVGGRLPKTRRGRVYCVIYHHHELRRMRLPGAGATAGAREGARPKCIMKIVSYYDESKTSSGFRSSSATDPQASAPIRGGAQTTRALMDDDDDASGDAGDAATAADGGGGSGDDDAVAPEDAAEANEAASVEQDGGGGGAGGGVGDAGGAGGVGDARGARGHGAATGFSEETLRAASRSGTSRGRASHPASVSFTHPQYDSEVTVHRNSRLFPLRRSW